MWFSAITTLGFCKGNFSLTDPSNAILFVYDPSTTIQTPSEIFLIFKVHLFFPFDFSPGYLLAEGVDSPSQRFHQGFGSQDWKRIVLYW